MNKLTILFLVVCAIALVSADPIRKSAKKGKAAKIVRASSKTAKLVKPVRRSGKLHLIENDPCETAVADHHIHHEAHHFQHEPHHLHHEQQHHHVHEGETVLHEEHHITAVPVEDEHHHVHLVPVEDEVVLEDSPAPVDDVIEIAADEIPEEVEVIVKETPFAHAAAAAPAHGSFFNTHFGAANNGAIGMYIGSTHKHSKH